MIALPIQRYGACIETATTSPIQINPQRRDH